MQARFSARLVRMDGLIGLCGEIRNRHASKNLSDYQFNIEILRDGEVYRHVEMLGFDLPAGHDSILSLTHIMPKLKQATNIC